MRRVLSLLMGLQTCFQMTVGKKKRYFPCHKSQTWAVRSQEVTELCAFNSLCTKSTDIIDVLSRRMMRMAPRTAPSVDSWNISTTIGGLPWYFRRMWSPLTVVILCHHQVKVYNLSIQFSTIVCDQIPPRPVNLTHSHQLTLCLALVSH